MNENQMEPKNRANENQECGNCAFVEEQYPLDREIVFYCRRKSPEGNWNCGHFIGVWPEVYEIDWCGEFKKKPINLR